MELLSPSIGIIFWTCLSFLIVVILLSKFAWKPIIAQLKKREDKIALSLEQAKEIEQNLLQTKDQATRIIAEANAQSKQIIAEAKKHYEETLVKSGAEAKKEAERIIKSTVERMDAEKQRMMIEVQQVAVDMVVEVAEKVLAEKLKDAKQHHSFIKKMVDELSVAGK